MNMHDRYRNWLRTRAPHALSGAIKITVDKTGTPTYTPAVSPYHRPMSSIDEAAARIDALGITKFHDMREFQSVHAPLEVREFQRHLSETMPGYRVELFSANLRTPGQEQALRDLLFRDGKSYGYAVDDDGVNTVMRVFKPGSTSGEWAELTSAEVYNMYSDGFLGRTLQGASATLNPETRQIEYNLGGILGPKGPKRSKQNIVGKQFELSTTSDIQITIRESVLAKEVEAKLKKHFHDVIHNSPELRASVLGDSSISGQESEKIRNWVSNQLAEASKVINDGFNVANESFFRSFVEVQRQELDRLLQELSTTSDPILIRQIQNEMRATEGKISQIENAINNKKGGISNVRFEGGFIDERLVQRAQNKPEASRTPAERAVLQALERFQLKGNLTMVSDANYHAIMYILGIGKDSYGQVPQYGPGIITTSENIKPEAGRAATVGPGSRSQGRTYASLSFHESSWRVILDEQTISSNPDVFNSQYMAQLANETLTEVKNSLQALTTTGKLPSSVMERLQAELHSADDIRSARAANILQAAQEGVDFRMHPELLKQAIESINDAATTTKGQRKVLNINLPNTLRAEIVSESGLSADLIPDHISPTNPELLPVRGEIDIRTQLPELRFDAARGAFVMKDEDVVRYRASFGGFDLDDQMFSMLRYDRHTDQFIGFSIRQPNAPGEHLIFRINERDEFISKAIANKKSSLRSELKSINEQIREVERRKRIAARDHSQSDRVLSNLNERLNELQADLHTRLNDLSRANELTRKRRTLTDERRKKIYEGLFGELGEGIKQKAAGEGPVPGRRASVKIPLPGGGHAYLGERGVIYEDVSDLASSFEDNFARRVFESARHMKIITGETGELGIPDIYEVMARMRSDAGRRNIIGQYINPLMVMSHWQGTHLENLDDQTKDVIRRIMSDGEVVGSIKIIETEDLIDVVKDPSRAKQRADRLVKKLYEIVTVAQGMNQDPELNFGLDPALVEARIAGFKQAQQEGIEAGNQILRSMDYDIIESTDALMMPANDPRAVFSVMRSKVQEIEMLSQEYLEDIHTHLSDHLRAWEAPARYDEMAKRALAESRFNVQEGRLDYRYFADEMDSMRRAMGVVAETFVDGRSTEATYALIGRMLQLSASNSAYDKILNVLYAVQRDDEVRVVGGLVSDAVRYVESKSRIPYEFSADSVGTRYAGTYTSFGLEDLFKTIKLLPDEQAYSILSEIMEGSTVTARMVAEIDEGLRLGYDGEMPIRRRFRNLISDTNAFVADNVMRSPMSLGTTIEFQGNMSTLNELLYEYYTGGEQRDEIARTVRNAIEVMYSDVMDLTTQDPRLAPSMRERALRAAQIAGDTRTAENVAAMIEKTKPTISGGMFNRINARTIMDLANTVGRGRLLAGAAAIGGLIAYNRKRDKDYTLNDMQGPDFLPGGNPYTDDFDHAVQVAMQRESLQGYGGTTYQIRAQGTSHSPGLASSIQAITGGSMSSTTYDQPAMFAHENARDMIMRRYS